MLQNQHYNMINHTIPQIPTRKHNKTTMSHHQIFNETWNNIFPSKETKEKLTLMSIWEYGAWVLGSWRSPSSSCQWIIFLTMKSKKRGSIGRRRHVDAKKNGFENGFHQKYVCGKSAKKHKDLKKYWGRWMREGWEA